MRNISFYSLRLVKEKGGRYDIQKKVTSPSIAYDVSIKCLELDQLAEEMFVMLTLDTKNNVTGIFEVSRGSLNSSIVHPREVFKRALLQNASSIILVHNHPSGDSKPSKEDINITKRLKDGGKILGIEILDHIIVGHDEFYSMKEQMDI